MSGCPISAVSRVLGRRWALELLYLLRHHHRFCDLQSAVGGLNPTTLTRRLRELEQAGLIERGIVSAAPVQIEYRLSEMGRELNPVLDKLASWSQRWLPEEG